MKKIKLDKPKRIKGKIFKSYHKWNDCECGLRTEQRYYTSSEGYDIALGFCECGNVFVAQLPRKSNV